MMKANNVSVKDINEALRNSFSAIRKDMTELKRVQGYQRVSHSELKTELAKMRDGFDKRYVSADKMNLVKIRLGELNDNFKRVWQLEKNVTKLSQDSLNYSDFDKEVTKIHSGLNDMRQNLELFKKDKVMRPEIDEMHDELTKRYDNLFVNVEKVRDGFDKDMKDVEERRRKDGLGVTKQLKQLQRDMSKSVDAKQINRSISDLDNKMLSLRDEIGRVSIRAEENISQSQIDTLVKDVNKEFNELKDNLKVITTSLSGRVTSKQVSKMVADTNLELEQLKKYMANIDSFISSTKVKDSHIKSLGRKIEKEAAEARNFYALTKKEVAERVSGKQMSGLLKEINGEFNRLNKEVGRIHGELDFRVNENQIKNFVGDLNKEFDTLKSQIDDYRKDIFRAREGMKADVGKYKRKIDSKANAASITAKIEDINKSLKKAFTQIDAAVTRNQAEKLVEDVNNEFDVVRKELKKMDKSLKDKVSRSKVEDLLRDINGEFVKVHDAVDGFKKLKKDFEGFKKGKVNSKVFDAQLDGVDKKFKMVTKELSRMKANFVTEGEVEDYFDEMSSKISSNLKKAPKKRPQTADEILASVSKKSQMTRTTKKTSSKVYGVGNFLIVGAFVLLVASIVSFVYGNYPVMNILAVVAIVSFLVGILMRVYVVFKRY